MVDYNILFANKPTATPSDTMRNVLQNQSAYNEFQQQPTRNALLQSQAEGAQLSNQGAQQQLDADTARMQLGDMATDAIQIMPLIQSGDLTRANVKLAERIQKIQRRGGDPSDTMAFRDALNSGQLTPEQAGAELGNVIAAAERAGALDKGLKAPDPYYTNIQTSTGVYQQNARTGELKKIMDESGNPVLPVSADARVQGDVSRSREQAKSDVQLDMKPQIEAKTTEARAKAQDRVDAEINLPQFVETSQYVVGLLDQMANHPGLDAATGASSRFDPRNYTPGTDAYSFNVLKDQIQGQAFLQAFESLKGGGPITDVEGKKATDAIARLNSAQKKEDFLAALDEFKGIIRRGMERAQRKAWPASQAQGQPAGGGVDPDLLKFMTPEERALFQ